MMRQIRCNACGADGHSVMLVGRDLLHDLPGEYTLVRCDKCGLLYLNPQPTYEELRPHYPYDYEPHVGSREEQLNWLRRIDYRYGIEKRYRAIMRYCKGPGTMLDVGCGPGTFLAGMREHDWRVAGIEPSPGPATYAREELGLEVEVCPFEDATLPGARYDLVTMWNVLEHLSDPSDALRRVTAALKPGGLLVFAIPGTESYDRKIFGRYWAGYDIPRHLYVFPPATLEKMVVAAGLDVLERRCIYGTYHALAYSAQFAMKSVVTSQPIRRALKGLLLSLPVRALMIPPMRIVDALGRGTIVTWFCRRVGRGG